ncbi:MAG: hypothetical protein ABIZ04_12650 [Opitutus sp.]
MPNVTKPFPNVIDRRGFIKTSSLVALAGALRLKPSASAATGSPALAPKEGVSTDDILSELVRANDAAIPALLARQERRAGHRWLGGVYDRNGLHNVRATAGLISTLVCAASAERSRYFKTGAFTEPLRFAVADLLKAQHDDGTIDFESTNFHSSPDTAFVVEFVAPACELMRTSALSEYAQLGERLRTFIIKAADGLLTGGVHTPNHRWAVCSALAVAYSMAPNPQYLNRIDEWFAEKIDIDVDGQYDERSTSVYSPVIDRSLLTIARYLNRWELLEPVRRNLEMTLYYVHPDGEVATEASRRQDRYERGSMARYYMSYRYLAVHDRNGRFAAMARWTERVALPQLGGIGTAGWLELASFLTVPTLREPLPPDSPLPTDYVKVFAGSHLARIRRGKMSATVLAQNTTIVSFHKGAAALEAVRLASAFFGKGQFAGEKLVVENGRYTLRQKLEGPYYLPLTKQQIAQGLPPTLSATTGALAVEHRQRSHIQTLESLIEVSEENGRLTLKIDVRGTDNVPLAIELAFRHGGKLDGVELVEGSTESFLLKTGEMGLYTFGGETIEFGPGFADHSNTHLRGALPKWEGQSVFLTGCTPFTTTLTIS